MLVDEETGEVKEDKLWRAKDTSCAAFWDPLLKSKAFELACNKRFQLGGIVAGDDEDSVDVEDEV